MKSKRQYKATIISMPEEKLRLVDLCAGTGGFSRGFMDTGHVEVVFANDMIPASKSIYDLNFDHQLTLKDLHDVDIQSEIPEHDILTAGFPCQPFSISGKRAGFDDPRSNIFWKILQIIDARSPRAVVLENVKNLVTHDAGNTFKVVIDNLTDRGYHVVYKVLNTSRITGIPQHRERIYIVGLKTSEVSGSANFSLDFDAMEKRSVRDMLMPVDQVLPKYYYGPSSVTWPLVEANVTRTDTVYQYRRVYVRENKNKECPTLTANMGSGGHNVPLILDDVGIRKLTPRECFNFQGFPSDYNLPDLADCHLYKLAGNAISVPVVRLIADRLVDVLL